MADEQQRGPFGALDVHEQVGDGRLYRNIEGRDRLVGHHDRGIAGKCPGYADPLLLSAGKLTWPASREIMRQLDQIEQVEHPRLYFRLVLLDAELADDPRDLEADRVAGVERVERILEDHLQAADGLAAALLHGQMREVEIGHAHRARRRLFEAHQDLGEGRLAAAGLANDGHGLGHARIETQVIVGPHLAEALAELVDVYGHGAELQRLLYPASGRGLMPGNLVDAQAAREPLRVEFGRPP